MRHSRELPYLLFLPKHYEEDPTKRWPLILFLHGSGERGSDPNKIKKYGLPKLLEENPNLPFIVVSPLCPAGLHWTFLLKSINNLLDHLLTQHQADSQRIYLTGISMGGYGAWYLSMAYPDRFAAVVPICGGGDPRKVNLIKHLPIWVFHGGQDYVVPLKESEIMVSALRKAGSNVKFTIYPEAGHDSWTETYANPELYEWFLQHKK